MENKIAANLYSQLDDEGREIFQFKGIIDHNTNGSVLTNDTGFDVLKVGHKKCNPTTYHWQVLVEWRYETTNLMEVKASKESILVELAEYAVSNNIDCEPDLAWWLNYIFKKPDRIIAKVNTKYWRDTHKYGVRISKMASEAL